MSNDHTNVDHVVEHEEDEIRDIHALATPPLLLGPGQSRRRGFLETGSRSSSTMSEVSSENFTSISREFNALVLAGSAIEGGNNANNNINGVIESNLRRIGEDEPEETNPLAIVPDNNPLDRGAVSPRHVSLQRVKKEEVEAKISAWQTAKLAKINNRFKREDAIIQGWETAETDKATSRMKKVERKLEEKRAKASERMQNDIARARRKAEEKKASAEAKRGTRATKIMELANLMRAVGRAPSKKSFF